MLDKLSHIQFVDNSPLVCRWSPSYPGWLILGSGACGNAALTTQLAFHLTFAV
jgi:hypothetical protein